MTAGDRVAARSTTTALLAAAACSFTFLGWSDLAVDPSGYTRPLIALALGVAAAGVVLRSLGVPRPLVVTLQVVGVAEALHVRWAGDAATGGWLPNATSLAEVSATLGRAVDAAQQWPAPVPERVASFDPLMIAIGAAVILLVDASAVTYRRPVVAGLPLLAAFTVPAAVTGGMGWDHFVLAAGAYLLLVAADQLHVVGRWGRSVAGVGADDPGTGVAPSTVELLARSRGALVRVLAPSLLLAALAPLVVPDDAGFLGDGAQGGGEGEVSIDNPMADLRRDLVLGPDVNLLTVRTDDPDPSYLRISALDEFDGETWRPSRRDLPVDQRIHGTLPGPVGLDDDVEQSRYRYSLQASDELDSRWLPLPFPAITAEAPGDWRYDAETLDVTTIDADLDTSGLEWSATGLRPAPSARQLIEAPAPPARVGEPGTALPFDGAVPEWLSSLVDDLTAGTDSDFAAAVALQRWFRDPQNFRYSTDREPGNGLDDLRTFLTPGPDGRVGYCEQFASAMAVMARVAGIPARVAMGFLQPDAVLPGVWLYSARDLHTWPELYFTGVGWVRFEPTPADRAPSTPRYTVGQLPQVQEETRPTASVSAPSPTRSVRAEDPLGPAATQAETQDSSRWWLVPVLAALVLLLLATPRLLRRRHRGLRSRAGSAGGGSAAEASWEELRASVLDLRHEWPDLATLRAQQQHLLGLVRRAPVGARVTGGAPPTPAEEVQRAVEVVVRAVERARFSPAPTSVETGREAWQAAQVVVGALWARAETPARRSATWWPRSLWVGAPPEESLATDGGTAGGAIAQEDRVRV